MKKILMAMAVAVLAMGCTEELEQPGNQGNQSDLIDFTFKVGLNGTDTKTVNDGLKTRWVAGDEVSLYASETAEYNYTKAGIFATPQADGNFQGQMEAALTEGNHNWLALYSERKDMGVTFSTQLVQKGNDNMAHLCGPMMPMFAVASDAPATGLKMMMNHMAAILKVTVTNKTSETLNLSSLTLSKTPEPVAGNFNISYDGEKIAYEAPVQNKNNQVQVKLEQPLDLRTNEQAILYLAFKPFKVEPKGKLTLSVNQYAKEITIEQGAAFLAGNIQRASFSYDEGMNPVPPVEGEFSVWDGNYGAPSFEGKGTAAAPYLIKSAADFAAMAHQVNITENNSYNGKIFRLETNIDLNNLPFHAIGVQGTNSAFNGTLDGNGHTIKNIKIIPFQDNKTEKNQLGLFKYTRADTKIRNLILENITVKGAADAAGALVGCAGSMKFLIENVTVINPQIQAARHAGGIVGIGGNNLDVKNNSDFLIKNCQVIGGEIQANNVGGIFGSAQAGIIIGCSSATKLTGNNCAGGIVGQGHFDAVAKEKYKYDLLVAGCYTNSEISSNNALAGGIAGLFKGRIESCYSVSKCHNRANANFANKNSIVSDYIYRVDALPQAGERLEETIHNCYCPGSVEPIWLFHYKIGTDKIVELPKENNGYWFDANGKNQPKASYMAMKTPKAIASPEILSLNESLKALTAPEFFGLNNYKFELRTNDPQGFPAVLVLVK